jgi:glycosyltransferase involved in cell wall biosynthesis
VRDPWTNNKTAFGYWNLSPKRFNFEKEAEREVVNGYDKILTVADGIGEFFVSEYGIKKDKIITLKNGFDSLDFQHKTNQDNSKQVIIFTGNLYEKAEKSFLMLVNQLKALKVNNNAFFEQYEIHFYGEIHPNFKHYFTPELNLFFKGNIPLSDVFGKIASAKACLLFLTDDLNYSFSTKFYEYLSQKKPIIVFSNPGKTGEFVEEHNLGRQATADNFIEILKAIDNNEFYKKEFDISEFEVSNLTKQLLGHLELN